MIICDSGYDSEANIVYIHENEIRSLIMPNITARFINKQIRKAEEELEMLSGMKMKILKKETWTDSGMATSANSIEI